MPILSLKGSARALVTDHGGMVVDYSTSVITTKKGIAVETSVCLEITNSSGRNLSDISIHYRKGEEPEITEACIIDRYGAIVRKISKRDIEISSDIASGTFFSDEYKMSFNLYWDEYPYRIRYKYRKEITDYIYLARWTPYYHPSLPVRSASLSITIPAESNISFFRRGKFVADSTRSDKTSTYNWKAVDLPSLKREFMAPPLTDFIPLIIALPSEFKYDIQGRLDSWQSYGQWYSDLTAGLDELTPAEEITVKMLIQGISDKREIVRRLYYYLQDNTRYVNVSLETGGLKPFPATYVCNNKFGDCKALSVYMKALLKEAGIEGLYVLVNAGESAAEIIRDAPGPQFNHMILCVPLDNDTIWLDNTSTSTPLGYIDTGISGRTALVIDGSKSRLVTTPVLSVADLINVSRWTMRLNDSGNGAADLTMFMRGNSFHSLSYYRKNLGEKKLRDTISELIPFTDAELQDWTLEQPDRDSGLIILRSTLEVSRQINKIGKYLVLRSVRPKITLLESPEERKHELLIRYPIAFSDTIVYITPFKSRYTTEIPDEVLVISDYGSLEINAIESPEGFILTRKVVLEKGRYSIDTYESFYSFMTSLIEVIYDTQILLKEK